MQKATRNTFTQKGAEVQKIDQGGIWAQIVDSYPNPDFESVCFSQEVGGGSGNDDEFVSVAKWVYKCRRLIRKSGHIVASIRNGEIFHPCYYVEPSTDQRFENGTIVWLEPLPQLNGYLLIPGGVSQCGSSQYYPYDHYSGGYSSDGDSSSGYSGLDCSSLLSCLCVRKDSEGRVIGVFVKSPDGSLIEIEECYGDSSGSGYSEGDSWESSGSGYSEGESSGGESDGSGGGESGGDSGSESSSEGSSGSSGGSDIGGGSESGEGSNESGDSSDSSDSSGGDEEGGGGGGCCPPFESEYVLEYDLTVLGTRCTGVTNPEVWLYSFTYYLSLTDSCTGCSDVAFFSCNNGNLSAYYSIDCGDFFSCNLYPDDFEITVTGCPGSPTFYLTIKPGRCVSGSFVLRPA